MNKLMRCFYSLCTDAPFPLFFWGGEGVCTQATILLVKRIKMIGMLLNFSQRRSSPEKVTKKNIYTGKIKTFVGFEATPLLLTLLQFMFQT